MKRLNRLGVRLAIDDFGTGHSSLAYLGNCRNPASSKGGPGLRARHRGEHGGLGHRPGGDRPGQYHGHRDRGRGRGDQGPGRRAPPATAATWRRATISRRRCGPGSSTRSWPVCSLPAMLPRPPGYLVTRRDRRDLLSLTPTTTRPRGAGTSHGARISRSLPVISPLPESSERSLPVPCRQSTGWAAIRVKCAWWRCGGGPSGRRELVPPEVPHWVADQAVGVLAEGGHALAGLSRARSVPPRRAERGQRSGVATPRPARSCGGRGRAAGPNRCCQDRTTAKQQQAPPRSARTWPTTRCTARSRPGSLVQAAVRRRTGVPCRR